MTQIICEIPDFDTWYGKNMKELHKEGLNKRDDRPELEILYQSEITGIKLHCAEAQLDEIKRKKQYYLQLKKDLLKGKRII